MKLQGSDQLQTVLALYDQELNRDKVAPSYQQLRTMVRQHVDQTIRTRNSRARMKDVRRERWSRVEEEDTSARKEKWDNVFSGKPLDSVQEETRSFTHGEASGNRRNPGLESYPGQGSQIILLYFENADSD